MSKTKLLLDLITDIRSVADDLETLCNSWTVNDAPAAVETPDASKQTVEPPAAAASVPTVTPAEPSGKLAPNERIDPATGEIVTLDLLTLRALAASKAQTKEQKAQMKALLQKHGVAKLTELPLTDYFAFQKEVEAIV